MRFKDDYYFLSNMYPCDIEYDGIVYPCVESAFQAQKTDDITIKEKFAKLNGYQAKKEGRKVNLRPDWENVKVDIMRDIVEQKFLQNDDIANKLVNLPDVEIVEDNSWNDTFWGRCKGKGENHLGEILMDVRNEFQLSKQGKDDKFYLLVAGSRDFDNYEMLEKTLDDYISKLNQDVVIVQGGARGADSLAGRYAREHNIQCEIFPADWNKYGKSAGYRRNYQMHEFIAQHDNRSCVCFWDGQSKGTAHNFKLAQDFGTKLDVVRTDVLNADKNKNINLISNGDMFQSNSKCIVNAVNCVGVMGAGLAAAFKVKYPDMFKEYKDLCNKGELKPGVCHLYHAADGKDILNFPTKVDWRNPSKIEYIEKGLDWIVENQDKFDSIAIPAIGCGLGGLKWNQVKNIIIDKLKDTNINIELYEPVNKNNVKNVVKNENEIVLNDVAKTAINPLKDPSYVRVMIPDLKSDIKFGFFAVNKDSIENKNDDYVAVKLDRDRGYLYFRGKDSMTLTGKEIENVYSDVKREYDNQLVPEVESEIDMEDSKVLE